ncbi:MAG: GAF domain-containing protein [Holophagaceae bacterium]|nr:GAF domain-containing protein [Holophagaceae bacterium]
MLQGWFQGHFELKPRNPRPLPKPLGHFRLESGALRMHPGAHFRDTHPMTAKAKSSDAPDDHMSALGELVERAFMDATQLFDLGLHMLVRRLKVDRALVSRQTDLGFETFWWAQAPDKTVGPAITMPGIGFLTHPMDEPTRSLVIRDAAATSRWRHDPAFLELGIRAFIGVPLRELDRVIGVVCVEHGEARDFTRQDVALVEAVAGLIGKTLEVEALRYELRLTRDALDLTSAVVEDSALQAMTGLPNNRYLDVWLKANLYLAKRRKDAMAMVLWRQRLDRASMTALKEVNDALRGEDLLVDRGRDCFLLLLPHTPLHGAQILLDRIREKLGPVPMGATMWEPEVDDLATREAMARLERALKASQAGPGAEVVWEEGRGVPASQG